MKRVIILVCLILFICASISVAATQIGILVDREKIQKDEEVKLKLELKNVEIASFTMEIYFDGTKLKYISGPENTSIIDNRILYTWVSENAENENQITTENFVFKTLEEGVTGIFVTGEFYNSNGERVQVEDNNIEIKIENEEEAEIIPQYIMQENIQDNNVNLAVLRLNYPGISPDFNKDIEEYYIVVDSSIEDLEVTAFAEKSEAVVTVTGNKNLNIGKNIINITVQSKDKSKIKNYKINVTKTTNMEMANANLENLAVREGTLNPEFSANVTNYYMEIENGVDKVQVLAVPQNENTSVQINQNNQMNIGDNKIDIVVVAQDKITTKKYEINVHRRNEVEEMQKQEEQKQQVQKLSAILENNEIGSDNIENILQQENNVWAVVFIGIGILLIGIFFIIKMNNKKIIK